MSGHYLVHDLSKQLDEMSGLEMKALILHFCQDDANLRSRVAHYLRGTKKVKMEEAKADGAGDAAASTSNIGMTVDAAASERMPDFRPRSVRPSPTAPNRALLVTAAPPRRLQSAGDATVASVPIRGVTPPPRASTASAPARATTPLTSATPPAASSRPVSPTKEQRESILKRPPPRKQRILAHRNGNKAVGVAIAAGTLRELLDIVTPKLQLLKEPRRAFDEKGTELTEELYTALPRDSIVYVSSGESFIDPDMPANERLALTRAATPSKLPRLAAIPDGRFVVAFRNGYHFEPDGVRVAGHTVAEIVTQCTDKLGLHTAARYIYTIDGELIVDLPSAEDAAEKLPDTRPGTAASGWAAAEEEEAPRPAPAPAPAPTPAPAPADDLPGTPPPGSLPVTERPPPVRKVFLQHLPTGVHVFVCCKEPFRDPRGNSPIKSHIKPLAPDSRLFAMKPVKYFHGFKNGEKNERDVVRVCGRDVASLLEDATHRLNLAHCIRRAFIFDGSELVDFVSPPDSYFQAASSSAADGGPPSTPDAPRPASPPRPSTSKKSKEVLFDDLEPGAHVWFSCGEPFIDPKLSYRDARPILSKDAPPPRQGETNRRLVVMKNGENLLRESVRVVGRMVEEMLYDCQKKLNLQGQAARLFVEDGREIVDVIDENARPGPEPRLHTPPVHAKKRKPPKLLGSLIDENKVHAVANAMVHLDAAAGLPSPFLAMDFTIRVRKGPASKCVALCELANEVVAWVSCGEPFKSLTEDFKTRREKSLAKEVYAVSERLLAAKSIRVSVFRNGWYAEGGGKSIVGTSLEQLCVAATRALGLTFNVTKLYDDKGVALHKMDHFAKDMVVFASCGEPFKDPAEKKKPVEKKGSNDDS